VRERLIEAVEKTYGAYSYAQLSEERDRKELAVLTALASVNHDKKEN
jgi:ketoreductase RED1